MFLKSFFVLIFIGFILSGCSSSAPSVAQIPKEIPAWVNNPIQDDSLYMYGVSIEADRDSAIKAALSDMVAKLGTTVQSSYESNQEVRGSYNKLIVKNQIKSDVAKIKINNYEVVQSYRISYREFAVMIKTDKKKFVTGLLEELKSKKDSIDSRHKATQLEDALSKYNVKKGLLKEANSLLSNVFIIGSLANSLPQDIPFNKKDYLDFISDMESSFIKEKKSLNFYVYGDDNSQKFVSNIKNYLAKEDFNVLEKKRNDSVVVKVTTLDNVNTSGAIEIAVLTLNIEVFNNSKSVGGKSIILKERYNGSKSSVYKNASIHLEQDIQEQGINQVIGINLDTSHIE